jgi:hypothetical protein
MIKSAIAQIESAKPTSGEGDQGEEKT